MIYLLEKETIFNTFNVSDFDTLESVIYDLAPSMCEYYLQNIVESSFEDHTLNRSNIQQSITIDNFLIHIDYSNQIFLEQLSNPTDDYNTESLW